MIRKQPKASHGYCPNYRCDLHVHHYMHDRLSGSMMSEVNPNTLHLHGCEHEFGWSDCQLDFTGIKQGAIGRIGFKDD